MNVLRTAFRQLASRLEHTSTSAIYGVTREAEVLVSAQQIAALRAFGERAGRGRHRRRATTAEAGRVCPVICGWRPARRPVPEVRVRTLVYPPIARNAGRTAEVPGSASGKEITIGHINIRSLVPKLDEVRLLIRQHELDAFCMTETWMTKAVSSDILLFPGYHVFREDRTIAKRGQRSVRGGGLAIVIRDDITACKLKVPPPEGSRLESLWLTLTAPGGRSAVLGATYRPPGEPVTPDIDALRQQLLEVSRLDKPVFLLGDLNLDLMRPEKSQVSQYICMLQELNFIQLIRDPTRPGTTPSLIDHVITNRTSIGCEAAAVVKTHVSDHDLITVRAPLPRTKRKPRELTTRSTRGVDFNHLCLDLLLSDWSALYRDETTSIDDLYRAFLENWDAAVDRHCPLKRVRLRHPDRPWLTLDDDLTELQHQRDAARRSRDAQGSAESERRYTSLRREFRRRLAAARADFFSAPSSMKEMWSELRKHALGPGKSTGPGDVPDAAAADRFNTYFAEVGTRIAEELAERRDGPPPLPRPPTVCGAAFTVRPATLPELSCALGRMSGSRAVGSDGVSLQLLRRCFAAVGPHLLRIVNASIITGKVPSLWKHAKVVPIFKSGDRSQPASFRPISVLSVPAKITEKVISIQLTEYLSINRLMSPTQYAYRPNRSTESAVVDLVSTIATHRDAGRVACLTSCDLSKAFDCVDRNLLFIRLGWYGISSHWFLDYFSNRTQSVGSGATTDVNHGVIQGSILGPIMFNIFTNDLSCHLPSRASVISYADDSQLIHAAPPTSADLTGLRLAVEADLAALSAWFRSSGLKVNPAKTELILFGTASSLKKTSDFKVSFDGAELKPAPKIKILGVVLDPELNMHQQVGNVTGRCYGSLITISKLRDTLPQNTLTHLIQALVFPHITYCLPAWAPPTQQQRHRIDKVINFATRIVTKKRRHEHITASRRALGWMPFNALIEYRDCVLMHSIIHQHDGPERLKALVSYRADVSERVTRSTSAGLLETSRCRLESTKMTVPVRSVRKWNELNCDVRGNSRVRSFKKSVKGSLTV